MINPEFQRNLWLEFSPQRLVVFPIALGALFALAFVWNWRIDGAMLGRLSLWAFVVIAFLWGTRRAAASLCDEVRGRTWDDQRLTAIGAWSMSWGKILGATAFTWYGGLICLAVLVFARALDGSLLLGFAEAVKLAATALLAQAMALLYSLIILRKSETRKRVSASLAQGLALATILPLSGNELFVFLAGTPYGRIDWFGWTIGLSNFELFTRLAFMVWAFLGAYRLMRSELQYKTMPWAWPAFVLFLIAFFEGLISTRLERTQDLALFWSLTAALLLALLSLYVAVFAAPKHASAQHDLLQAVQNGDVAEALRRLPIWVPSLAIMMVFGLGAVLAAPAGEIRGIPLGHTRPVAGLALPDPGTWIVTVMLFVLRDTLFLLFLNLGRWQRRADLAGFFYLLLLYGLCPPLAFAIFGYGGLSFFVPAPMLDGLRAMLPVLLELALVALLLIWRLRSLQVLPLAAVLPRAPTDS
jgi:hypothetical protein